jgi:hypothetical protein
MKDEEFFPSFLIGRNYDMKVKVKGFCQGQVPNCQLTFFIKCLSNTTTEDALEEAFDI